MMTHIHTDRQTLQSRTLYALLQASSGAKTTQNVDTFAQRLEPYLRAMKTAYRHPHSGQIGSQIILSGLAQTTMLDHLPYIRPQPDNITLDFDKSVWSKWPMQ